MFRFRLQRVLELRERTERDAATALASARTAVERAREEQARLQDARAELAGNTPADTSVGALRTLHFLLGQLDQRVAAAATDTTTAEHAADERQQALTSAFRDRRTLDRLRERHAESWRAAAAAADRQSMDEIALTRFAKPGGAAAATPDGKTTHDQS